MFKFLTALLYGPRALRFSTVEQRVLDSVCEMLPKPYQDFAREQLRLINFVQRNSNDKEVNLYQLKAFRSVPVPPNLALPNLRPEYRLAQVSLRSEQSNVVLVASVFVVNGEIFSIEFTRPPKELGESFVITESRLFADLLNRTLLDTPIDIPLPPDYLDLVRAGELCVNGWQIRDEHEIKQVLLPDDNYYILAENAEVGFVAIRCGDQSGSLVLIDFESDVEPIDSSFLEFVSSTTYDGS